MARRQRAIAESTTALDDQRIRDRVEASAKRLREKEALLDTFESRNSIFRNSLAYLPLAAQAAANDSAASPASARIGDELTVLLANVVCRSECDDAALLRVRDATAALTETSRLLDAKDRGSMELVLRHAAVFTDFSPQVDKAIDDVLESDGAPYENLFVALQDFHEHAAERADLFRVLLLLLSVGLRWR